MIIGLKDETHWAKIQWAWQGASFITKAIKYWALELIGLIGFSTQKASTRLRITKRPITLSGHHYQSYLILKSVKSLISNMQKWEHENGLVLIISSATCTEDHPTFLNLFIKNWLKSEKYYVRLISSQHVGAAADVSTHVYFVQFRNPHHLFAFGQKILINMTVVLFGWSRSIVDRINRSDAFFLSFLFISSLPPPFANESTSKTL
jgi:hypothetical protein